MGFTQKDRSGSWMSLRDAAKAGVQITVTRGFLEDDDSNTFKGKENPRHIIHGTIDGEDYKLSSPKGTGSRTADLLDMADYLEKAPAGSYITFEVEEISLDGGNTYNALRVVDSVDA